ncbi:hypothetical protein HBE96_07125 [Clostridium sp. P21]|uniref:Uncharacterized protein n=1 Tax=Clostridium muellerianum TaxID=2716538 RepID=A0A7Y0EFE7_9CLOT|nr:hypothetical protein [Clostridium muellerianum]NMM62465.1 hypothetical protein [Clostridium muellerianum]
MKNFFKKISSLFLITLLLTIGLCTKNVSAYSNSWNFNISQVTNVKDYGDNVYAIGNVSQKTYTGNSYNVNTKNIGIQCKIVNTNSVLSVLVDSQFIDDHSKILDFEQFGNTYYKTILVKNLTPGKHKIEIKAYAPGNPDLKSDYIYVNIPN